MFVSFTYRDNTDGTKAVEWIRLDHYEASLADLAKQAYAQLTAHYPTIHSRMTLVKILHEV